MGSYFFNFQFVLLSGIAFAGLGQANFFVDPGVPLVEFEGWGSSLAWFGDVLGGMPEDVQNEITDALFSPDKLNLNILRYTIGGTTPGNYTCGPYRDGGATESFRDGPNQPYNWTRDSRARKVLLAAQEYGVNIIEAFSNSPPQWMTISGCSKGNDNDGPLHRNFDPVNADIFADYLTEVVKYYHENFGISFQYLAPFNEPSSGYWNGSPSRQEGCNFDLSGMAAVIRSVDNSLRQKNLDFTRISVADETNIDVECSTQDYFRSQELSEIYSKVNTHGYGGSRRDLIYSISQRDSHVLWMDEMGWGATPANDMRQGLQVANRIVLDIRNMLPSAWVYWQVMEDQGPGFWGLLDIPYRNPTVPGIRYNSGYYAMRQFSQYIRQGFTIVHVNNGNALAAYDRKSEELVLVILNENGGPVQSTYDLGLFSSLGHVQGIRTSASEQNLVVPVLNATSSKKLVYTAPGESVTTLIITAAIVNTQPKNLIQNGEFENGDGVPAPWTLFFGNTGGANKAYIRRGNFSGFIYTRDSDISLNQNVIVEETRTHYLTAWCASSGPSAKLGVKINDEQGPELSVNRSRGYEVYGIQFYANAGDTVGIYLYGGRGDFESFIDDVILH